MDGFEQLAALLGGDFGVARFEGAGHAAPFDATANFVRLVARTITPDEADPDYSPARAAAES